MAVFPSKEWCDQAIAIVNSDPESIEASKGWKGDFGVVIEAEGALKKAFVAYAEPKDGKVQKFKVLVDADDLDEFEPAYLARAPYSVWKGLLKGTIDPVEAVLKRRIQLQGDVQQIMERMKYKGIAERLREKLETRFIDE